MPAQPTIYNLLWIHYTTVHDQNQTTASSTNNIQPAMDPLHNCTYTEPRLVPAHPTIYNLLWIHYTTVHDQNQTTASSTNNIQPAMDPLHNCTRSEPRLVPAQPTIYNLLWIHYTTVHDQNQDYCQLNQQYTTCYVSTTQLYMIRTKISASSTNNIQLAMDPLHNCT